MDLMEIILEELQIQNVESQSFAIKLLTELLLSSACPEDEKLMVYHLQVLKQNQNLLQKLVDHKLSF